MIGYTEVLDGWSVQVFVNRFVPHGKAYKTGRRLAVSKDTFDLLLHNPWLISHSIDVVEVGEWEPPELGPLRRPFAYDYPMPSWETVYGWGCGR